MVSLESLVRPELIFSDLENTDCVSVLHEVSRRMVGAGFARDAEELYQKLYEREELGSTGIGSGVAVPHCKCTDLGEILLAVGVSPHGIEFGADDGVPVRLLFVVLSPAGAPAEHLQCLAAISRWIRTDDHLDQILNNASHEGIYQLLTGSSSQTEPSAEPVGLSERAEHVEHAEITEKPQAPSGPEDKPVG